MTKSDSKPNILYKVVTLYENRRFSYLFNMNCFIKHLCREYIKGAIIEANHGTIGLLCFSKRIFATHFIEFEGASNSTSILELKPLSEIFPVDTVFNTGGSIPLLQKYTENHKFTRAAPIGTVSCMKVEVLT